jgi:hypothetical protein
VVIDVGERQTAGTLPRRRKRRRRSSQLVSIDRIISEARELHPDNGGNAE